MKNLIALSLTALLLTACGGDDNTSRNSASQDEPPTSEKILTNPKPVITSSSDAIAIAKSDLQNKDIDADHYDAMPINNIDGDLRLYRVMAYQNNDPVAVSQVPVYEGQGFGVVTTYCQNGILEFNPTPYERIYQETLLPIIQSRGGQVFEHRLIANGNEIIGMGVKTDANLDDLLFNSDIVSDKDKLNGDFLYDLEPYYIFSGIPSLLKFGDLRNENPQALVESHWLLNERKKRAQMLAAGRE